MIKLLSKIAKEAKTKRNAKKVVKDPSLNHYQRKGSGDKRTYTNHLDNAKHPWNWVGINIVTKYIEDIHIFGMNMPFISSSEAKNAYFMKGSEI